MPEPAIDSELLKILACPACDDRPAVELRGDALHCPKCGRTYPIENGIPMMVVNTTPTIDDTKGE